MARLNPGALLTSLVEPETRRLLQQALQERRSHVRLAAARALWRLQAPAEEILPVLTALLHHKLATVRRGALDGLAEMGGTARNSQTEVEPLLDDENEMVRRSARAAWKSITGGAASNSKKANYPAAGSNRRFTLQVRWRESDRDVLLPLAAEGGLGSPFQEGAPPSITPPVATRTTAVSGR